MLKKKEVEIIPKPFVKNGDNLYINSQNEYLHKYFKDIDFDTIENKTIHFSNNGRFALHDIIYFMLKIAGPSNLIVSSFNMNEISARTLIRAIDSSLVKSLKIILNSQKKHISKRAAGILKNFGEVKYTNIHAKVACISNENYNIVISTSSNLSRNENHEVGFIANDKETFNFYLNFVENEFDRAQL